MPRPHKYIPGRKVKTVEALAREIVARRYVYWGRRPMHPG